MSGDPERISTEFNRWLQGFKLFAERTPPPKEKAWRKLFQKTEEVVRAVTQIPEIRDQDLTGGVMVLVNTGDNPLISACGFNDKGRKKIPISETLQNQWVDKNLAIALGQALILSNYPDAQTSRLNDTLAPNQQLLIDGQAVSGGAFRIYHKGQEFILSFAGFGADLDEVVVLTAARISEMIDTAQAKNLAGVAGNELYLELSQSIL